jgi:hypothetical protein
MLSKSNDIASGYETCCLLSLYSGTVRNLAGCLFSTVSDFYTLSKYASESHGTFPSMGFLLPSCSLPAVYPILSNLGMFPC